MERPPHLIALAHRLGIATTYTDGLGRTVEVGTETLLRVTTALGTAVRTPDDAAEALAAFDRRRPLPPVIVAWDGVLPRTSGMRGEAGIRLEDGQEQAVDAGAVAPRPTLPWGYHHLTVDRRGTARVATVISAPSEAWQHHDSTREWGAATHLAALRSSRSRAVADLADFEMAARWIRGHGASVVTVLPLLPTFNAPPAEPSPYSAVSRLFWSELLLDLGVGHRAVGTVDRLDVSRADHEVRAALRDHAPPGDAVVDPELRRYAQFRGAQARLGRNWRDWPVAARDGLLTPELVDPDEERFHLVAQVLVREQLGALRGRLDEIGLAIGLDFAVGGHPDGYDAWSRQHLVVAGMSVGAPPDEGFPSGQDWGFPPLHPVASRREGHEFFRRAIAHQASVAGVLRLDHVMSLARLHWIPHGLGLDQGTYVDYPADELFAIVSLESHRHRTAIVGENLGTVPPEVNAAMARHRVRGIYVAMFAAHDGPTVPPPTDTDVAMVGSHDTPTFAGWLTGADIEERVSQGLLHASQVDSTVDERRAAIRHLAETVGGDPVDPPQFLDAVLRWLGVSASPLVIPWLEDFWLEPVGVNLPGTSSAARPNWQRPLGRLLDDVMQDPTIAARLQLLAGARRQPG
jgi:4-alpha-glucanotransferase